MGKGQGKKGRREAKTTAKKAKKAKLAAKIPKVRPPNPINKARKELSRKNSLLKINPLETTEVPTGPPKIHAKWPALFKKHIGIIESHIKSLDRVMQSMKSEMAEMSEKERMEWELGERGNWRVMCALMDRSRELLTSARTAAKGILPPSHLREKKGLGVMGTTFDPLEPKLAQRAANLGYTKRGKLGRDPDEVSTGSDGDSEMSDSSLSDSSVSDSPDDSDGEDLVANNTDSVPLVPGKKVPRFATVEDTSKDEENEATTNASEPNPYFIVDVNPTPIVLDRNTHSKESKKRAKEEGGEEKKSKKAKKEKIIEPPASPGPVEREIDFVQLEAQLKAELEATAPRVPNPTNEQKVSKKRRRSSDGDGKIIEKKPKKKLNGKGVEQSVEKEAKKDRSKKVKAEETPADLAGNGKPAKESKKKRKLEESSSVEDDPSEVIEKKAKKEMRTEKRKAEPTVDVEVDGGKKRKLKIKADPE